MNKFLLKMQMKFCAWRARTWDDRYYIARDYFDCGTSLMEYISPRVQQYRIQHEHWVTKYLWLERSYKRV